METHWKTVFKLQKKIGSRACVRGKNGNNNDISDMSLGPNTLEIEVFSNVPLRNRSTSPSPSEQPTSTGEQGPDLCSASLSHRTTYTPQEPPYLSLQVDCEGASKLNSAQFEKCLKRNFKRAI